MSVPANGDQIDKINSACSSDLFLGIDSIKMSFMFFFFNRSSTSSAQNINYMNHSSQSLS